MTLNTPPVHPEAARRYLGGNSAATEAQQRAAAIFTAGVTWQASRPITEEQVGAIAVYFGCDLSEARAALEAMRGVQQ